MKRSSAYKDGALAVRLLLEQLVDRKQRGLGVERVKDGLDEEEVDAAVQQRHALLLVRGLQLVER